MEVICKTVWWMIHLFSISERIYQTSTTTFSLFLASPEPSLLFSHTCLNLLWIVMFFFSDANDYFASYTLKLIACEGALWKASLSCHPLERHVNCTYRLLGGVTHHPWHNLISDIFSPQLERIYTRCWLKLRPLIGYSAAHLRVACFGSSWWLYFSFPFHITQDISFSYQALFPYRYWMKEIHAIQSSCIAKKGGCCNIQRQHFTLTHPEHQLE